MLQQNVYPGISDLRELLPNKFLIDEHLVKPLGLSASADDLISKLYETFQTPQKTAFFSRVDIRTPSTYRFVDEYPAERFIGPDWGLGTHSKLARPREIFVGQLEVDCRYGTIFLVDGKHRYACIVTSTRSGGDNVKLENVAGSIVALTDYYVFTECYKDCTVPCLEYLLFDVSHVKMLKIHDLRRGEVFANEPVLAEKYNNSFEFTLLRKGTVSINKNKFVECWLEVLQIPKRKSLFLSLTGRQLCTVPFLQVGHTYCIYHNTDLINTTNIELMRLNSSIQIKRLVDKEAAFAQINTTEHTCHEIVLSVPEILKRLKETKSILSFQGILQKKKLTPSLSSRTEEISKVSGFGTPGKKTHTLIFTDDSYEHELVLYINNWENMLVPMGLVPHMRIRVHNILPQKASYFKCCALTSFEAVAHEPAVHFDTANLRVVDFYHCDTTSYLGLGDHLPTNVLVWGEILEVHVRSLKIECLCDSCELISNRCLCDYKTSYSLKITITMYVRDAAGKCLVISKCADLLRLLLGLTTIQWKFWQRGFERVGKYIHNRDFTPFFSQDIEIDMFCQALHTLILVINGTKLQEPLELLCRKMESNFNENNGLPVWFCINAR